MEKQKHNVQKPIQDIIRILTCRHVQTVKIRFLFYFYSFLQFNLTFFFLSQVKLSLTLLMSDPEGNS